nr:terpene synthase TPS8 [Freesia caryophyllacea]
MEVVSAGEEVVRPIAKFSPSIWGDFFINHSFPLANDKNAITLLEQRVEELKRTVKELFSTNQYITERLLLIDDLQRLGIDYRFKQEIDEALKCINIDNDNIDDNMYLVALRFRLLRQQGYHVSSDVFSKFKDDNGSFKQEYAGDIIGLLQLYEATGLRTNEDSILDEALDFARYHMERMITSDIAKGVLADRIRHALEMPFHRSRKRLGARYYMSIYEKDEARNDILLELAKLDFTLLQRLYQDEIKTFTMWYNQELGPKKLSFSRDRAVENYFWALGIMHFEPELATGRLLLAKLLAYVLVWDDMYDAYGTFEELRLFTDVIERWDLENVDHLPEYMRVCLSSYSNFMREVEDELIKNERDQLKPYVAEMMKYIIDGFIQEAKWLNEGYIPTMEEYLANGLKTGGQTTLNGFSLLFMSEDKVTKDTLEWVLSMPNILKASTLIGRLLNDIKTTKLEHERMHLASSMQIYMNEAGVTEAMAIAKLNRMVADFWKDINKELLDALPFQKDFNTLTLNFARTLEVLYKHEDAFTHGSIQREQIDLMLVWPIQN